MPNNNPSDENGRPEVRGVPVNLNGRQVGWANVDDDGNWGMKITDPELKEFHYLAVRDGFATSFELPLPNFIPAV